MGFANGFPVGGDAGDSISTAGTVGYGATAVTLGTSVLGTNPPVITVYGYAGRFELEIPAGVTITGALMEFTPGAAGIGSAVALSGGFLAVDSSWPSSGFNSSTYATRASFPWPRRYNGSTLVDNLGAFQGGAAAFSGWFPPATAAGSFWSFGENLASPGTTHSVSGLVAQLQAFLDAEPAGIRSGSVSGTALPLAFALLPSQTFGGNQSIRTGDHPTTRPVLTVSYNTPPAIQNSTLPASPLSIALGDPGSFRATATDPEDGNIPTSIVWVSSLTGTLQRYINWNQSLGTYSWIKQQALSVGVHTITATATDSAGATASTSGVVDVHASRIAATARARPALAGSPGTSPATSSNPTTKPATSSRRGTRAATSSDPKTKPATSSRGRVRE